MFLSTCLLGFEFRQKPLVLFKDDLEEARAYSSGLGDTLGILKYCSGRPSLKVFAIGKVNKI
jgi:hypothetical protein